MDLSQSGKELIMAELQRRLDANCIDFSGADGGDITEDTAEAVASEEKSVEEEPSETENEEETDETTL